MTANLSFVHDRQSVKGDATIDGESQELVDVLQKIVQNVGALLDVRSCSVALVDAKGSTLVTMAALQRYGQKLRQTRFRLNEGVAGWVAKHRESLIINDVSNDARFKRLGRTPVGSIICVPLIHKGAFIGTLTASSPEVNTFDEHKIKMLSIFAEQSVLAITNARHAELAQRQANQLEMLMHLSRGITTSLEPESLYRTILADVRRLIHCQSATIYLFQEGAQELYVVGRCSENADSATEQQEYSADIQIADELKTTQRISLYDTLSVPALAAIHRHPMLHVPQQLSTETDDAVVVSSPSALTAELAAPFVSKGTLYGVLSLQRTEPFNSDELRLVRNLSNMAAAALENVALFQKVRADQEQLRAILTSSSEGIALLGINSTFIEVNAAFGKIFGMETDEIVGMECLELLSYNEEEGAESGETLHLLQYALRENTALPYVEVDLHIQDATRSIGLSFTPVSTPNEPFSLLVARDVTTVREATRMKANFLSMITHELRSPLNAINGYLDLALTGIAGDLNAQQREFLQRARGGSEHLYALVEDLLLVSRADAGQLRLSRTIISLQDIIANAVEEMELNALDHNVTIETDIARDFPRLYADGVRLQQVLRNLVSNALRFTASGGKVTISASIADSDPGVDLSEDEQLRVVKLAVSDTGSGISPEYVDRIFDRFYQIPGNGKGRSSGQGLGLAIVKMIVELHDGYVTVDSTVGEGSTFTCTLPCLLS